MQPVEKSPKVVGASIETLGKNTASSARKADFFNGLPRSPNERPAAADGPLDGYKRLRNRPRGDTQRPFCVLFPFELFSVVRVYIKCIGGGCPVAAAFRGRQTQSALSNRTILILS